jgi:hypothetical protein
MELITKEVCTAIQQEIKRAFSDILTRNGLKIKKNRATYNDSKINLRLEFIRLDYDEDAECLKDYVKQWYSDVKEEHIGKPFQESGKTYRLVGHNPRGRTKPWVIACEDGNRYKVTDKYLYANLGIKTTMLPSPQQDDSDEALRRIAAMPPAASNS